MWFALLAPHLSAAAQEPDVEPAPGPAPHPASRPAEDASYAVVRDGRRFDLDAFTIDVRVRLDRLDEPQAFVCRGRRGQLFTLYLYEGAVRMLVENAAGTYAHADAPPPAPGREARYTGTYDGTVIAIHRDGRPAARARAPGRIPSSDAPLHLGASGPNADLVAGALLEVRIYDRALPPAEVAGLHAGAPPAAARLIAHFDAADRGARRWPDRAAADAAAVHSLAHPERACGYRGIWYANQPSGDEYRFKYSGGMATYPQQHVPIACYDEAKDRTFFAFGAASATGSLLHMVSYFDHATGTVPQPVVLLDKQTGDAHDNPTLMLDDDGHVWVFSNAHGTARPSYVHRSLAPHSIDGFERVLTTNFSYSQPWHLPGAGWCFLHTRYQGGRFLYCWRSADGRHWDEPLLLARIEQGHYQVSWRHGARVGTAFNLHPRDTGLNGRSNLYYMATADGGRTWQDVRGETLTLPLTARDNPALVLDTLQDRRLVYLKQVQFDHDGRPVILFLTSGGYAAGPRSEPRIWHTARWDGARWHFAEVARSDHNYDFGSLYLETRDRWRLIAPTGPGPQPWASGGEMAMWLSADQGRTWRLHRELTADSARNHGYARHPVGARPDFYALWADGHGREPSPSSLWFTDREGSGVFRLPARMDGERARPERVR